MGGHDSGEVASSIAIRTIAGRLMSIIEGQVNGEGHELPPESRGEVLRMAILEANERITHLSEERGSDMGTTVTMALVIGNQATVANIGDSRTYLWREGKLHQISQDHSLVARLIAAGQLTAEEGRHFERRNEIYRALGDPHLKPDEIDVFQVTLRPLDALVLCSDGLWEMVRDEEIEQIMLDAPDLAAASQTLIDVANHNGGEDNITVIIAQALTNTEY
jgi:protein phosphatase